jgi:phosphatidylserine/phosphatidylglycerophosphate/cardiolipin synthase-like enzyme
MTPRPLTRRSRRRPATRPLLGWTLLLAAGCQVPPGHVAGCGPEEDVSCRAALARQLAEDSAAEAGCRPLRCGCTLVADPLKFLLGAGRGCVGRRLMLPLLGAPGPLAACADAPPAVPAGLRPAEMWLCTDGDEALDALAAVIDGACRRLDVLMFTWDDSAVGRGVAERLAARAGPGLRVRVLVDGGGNLIFGTPEGASAAEVNRCVCWLARQPYVEVVRTRTPLGHFDHRKLVVADGRLAWSGGRNFTAVGFCQRHDVSFTLQGPLAAELDERFERSWREQGGAPGEALPEVPADCPNAAARLVATGPLEHTLRSAVYDAVDAARRYVWVENPYLTDGAMLAKLARARHRGADVRVVLSLATDVPSVNRANRVTANRLLRAGVRVYLYPGLVHTKAAAADGTWAYLGSGNFDLLSLRRNYELGVLLGPCPALAELEERLFRADFRPEWELHEPLPLSPGDYSGELFAGLFL